MYTSSLAPANCLGLLVMNLQVDRSVSVQEMRVILLSKLAMQMQGLEAMFCWDQVLANVKLVAVQLFELGLVAPIAATRDLCVWDQRMPQVPAAVGSYSSAPRNPALAPDRSKSSPATAAAVPPGPLQYAQGRRRQPLLVHALEVVPPGLETGLRPEFRPRGTAP
jgi:hypothetical protein